MKLGIIAPYSDMIDKIRYIKTEPGISLMVHEAIYSRAVDEVKLMEKDGVEAIISRGATCAYIERFSNLPVIHCDYGVADLIDAVSKASKMGERIGVLSYISCQWMKPIIENYIGREVVFSDGYLNMRENQQQVKILKESGIDVIVGGIASVETAKSYGMKSVLVETRPETILQAINEAEKVVKAVRKERNELQKLSQILNHSGDAIILTDNDGKVQVLNASAKKLVFDILGTETLKSVFALVPSMTFQDGVRNGKESVEEIRTIKKTVVLLSQSPIMREGEREGMVFLLQDSGKIQTMENRVRTHMHNASNPLKYNINCFIGETEGARECRKKAERYATMDGTVLLLGESGTGKEIIAQSIHVSGTRKNGPFVAINCSTVEGSLLESELFGYSDGAFTGARKGGKEGLFEVAHNGTIFLDEIGNISRESQATLLRVIQEREVRRVGSSKTIPVNVRIIAATNCNLEDMVAAGNFRLDLYYRLKVLEIRIPPLRERVEDIRAITEHFCRKYNMDYDVIDENTMANMRKYRWPGNVRELQSFIEKASLLSDEIPINYLFSEYVKATQMSPISGDAMMGNDRIVIKKGTLEQMENQIFSKLYEECDCNKSKLASLLDISRVTVGTKISKITGGG